MPGNTEASANYTYEQTPQILEAIALLTNGGRKILPVDTEISALTNAITNFDKDSFNALNLFFNSKENTDDGINLFKINAYCSVIPDEYGYSEIRKLILDNLDSGINGIASNVLDDFLNTIMHYNALFGQAHSMYVDWVENRSNYYEEGDDIPYYGNGEDDDDRTDPWRFDEDVEQRRSSHFTLNFGPNGHTDSTHPSWDDVLSLFDIPQILDSVKEKIKSISDLIKEYIDLGNETLLKISFNQQIYGLNSNKIEPNGTTVYAALQEHKDAVGRYSPKIRNSLDKIQVIEDSNQTTKIGGKYKLLIAAVLDEKVMVKYKNESAAEGTNTDSEYIELELNVKERCDRIYNALKGYFTDKAS
ncbi:MAG: hypothetical protein IKO41_21370 [Lachnospiraceae bacterium]|nr:hypothetical protein [Lachnospiraceae bacterium]